MAKIVEPEAREPGPSQDALEVLRHVVMVEMIPGTIREQQANLTPASTEGFFSKPDHVLAEEVGGIVREVYFSAFRGFGRLQLSVDTQDSFYP